MEQPGTPANVGTNDQLGQPPDRAEFERWAASEDLSVSTNDGADVPGAYYDPRTQLAWSAWREAVVAERDCRTCTHWTPHHRSDVMHCSAPLRCMVGSSYQRQGVVHLWEDAPADAGF